MAAAHAAAHPKRRAPSPTPAAGDATTAEPSSGVGNFSNSSLNDFPDPGLLAGAAALSLSFNAIQTVPPDLRPLTARLTSLNLSHNRLFALPANLGHQLPLLKDLNLSHNYLQVKRTAKRGACISF